MVFTPFRLLCPKTDRIHVSIDIVVLSNDPKALKPFKIVVYSATPFPDTEAEAKFDDDLAAQLADLKLDPKVYGRDRQLTQQQIIGVYRDFFKDPKYGYEGVVFRDIATAPRTRKLHPCTQSNLLEYQMHTLATNLREQDEKAYEQMRLVVLQTADESFRNLGARGKDRLTHEAIGRHLVAAAYGTRVELDGEWNAFNEYVFKGYLSSVMNRSTNADQDADTPCTIEDISDTITTSTTSAQV